MEVKPRYENFIGGHWVPPVQGQYMQDLSPANARKFTEVPRSTKEDIELALDAAHAAREAWGETSLTERARVLNRIADVIEEHTEELAVAETWDNGKPVRETLAADIPLAADHFRYFAAETRVPDRHAAPRSTRTPWPTTSTSRSAWSARSSRSTSRC